VAEALRERGMLLMQDKRLLSVVALLAGEAPAGSWWSHPLAHAIFRCLESLEDEAIVCRLVAGKVTYVHRRLAPALLSVATAREPWQTRGLTPAARALLARVPCVGSGPASRELQQRLLVDAVEVHTESGRHETWLQPWPAPTPRIDPAEARQQLEAAALGIGAKPAMLPWNRK
jgi:hypothetical protein